MSLMHLQTALARIFTDEALRSEFLANPIATARRLDVDEREAATLARMNRFAMRHFANSLQRKRLLAVRKMLPLTARVLGNELDRLWRTAIHGSARAGHQRADAAAVVAQLCKLPADVLQPAWIADLARYELATGLAAKAGTYCLLRSFEFPVVAIAAAVTAGETPVSVVRAKSFGVWLRLGNQHSWVRVWSWAPGWHAREPASLPGRR